MSTEVSANTQLHKPWFDQTCVTLRKKMLLALRDLRRSGHSAKEKHRYLELDKQYRDNIKQKKSLYYEDVTDRFANLRDPKQFFSLRN